MHCLGVNMPRLSPGALLVNAVRGESVAAEEKERSIYNDATFRQRHAAEED